MRLTFLLANQHDTHENQAVAELAEAMQMRGHDVHVIATDRKASGLLGRVKALITAPENDHIDRVRAPFRADVYDFRSISASDNLRTRDIPDADVLIATCWKTAQQAHKLPLCKGSKVHYAQRYELLGDTQQEAVKNAWCLPNFKIVSSRKLAEFARRNLNIDIYHVIHNSLDLETYAASPRRRNENPKVGFYYSNHRHDGSAMAINALENLRKDYPTLEAMAFCKPGTERKHALPDWIGLRDSNNHREISSLMSECDLWLQTNITHDFGQLALHALACRCPVAAFPVGGMPEIIANGRNGNLSYLIDDSALTEAADKVLSVTEEKWQKLSEHAWVTASSYDWLEAAELLEYTLQAAIDHDSERVDNSLELAAASI